jgi:AcrR family transcriptional regulator
MSAICDGFVAEVLYPRPMAESGRVYGGVSASDRRAERRRRLLDAGLELFGTRGVAEVTIGDVCVEAGLAKRYFYDQFDGLDDFVDAVIDDVVQRLQARVIGERSPDDPEWPRRRLATFVESVSEDPRVARLLLVETFGANGSLAALRQAVVHRAVESIVADFLPADAPARPADDRKLRMAAFALSGAAAELILAWLQHDVKASADEIVDYLVGLFRQTPALVREP